MSRVLKKNFIFFFVFEIFFIFVIQNGTLFQAKDKPFRTIYMTKRTRKVSGPLKIFLFAVLNGNYLILTVLISKGANVKETSSLPRGSSSSSRMLVRISSLCGAVRTADEVAPSAS